MGEKGNRTLWVVILDLDGTVWQGSLQSMSHHLARSADADELNAHLAVFPGTREALERLQRRDDVVLGISSCNLEEIGLRILEELDLLKYFDPANVVIAGPDKGGHVREIIENTLRARPGIREGDLHVIFVDDRFYYHQNVCDENPGCRITCLTAPGHQEYTDSHYREIFDIIG